MLDITKLKDGFVSLHTKHGGQIFLYKEGEKFFSTNLDSVDPDNYRSEVVVDPDGYTLGENVSDERMAWMRNQAAARSHINNITTQLQLKQALEQAKQVGIIQQEQPRPEPPTPPETRPEPPQQSHSPMPPKLVDDNPGAPASTPENDRGYKDGAVVEVPAPNQK